MAPKNISFACFFMIVIISQLAMSIEGMRDLNDQASSNKFSHEEAEEEMVQSPKVAPKPKAPVLWSAHRPTEPGHSPGAGHGSPPGAGHPVLKRSSGNKFGREEAEEEMVQSPKVAPKPNAPLLWSAYRPTEPGHSPGAGHGSPPGAGHPVLKRSSGNKFGREEAEEEMVQSPKVAPKPKAPVLWSAYRPTEPGHSPGAGHGSPPGAGHPVLKRPFRT